MQMKQALLMAVKGRINKRLPLIHHSDRGLQYCSAEYVSVANQHQIKMSMTEKGDPYENALAERINRTLKEEFGIGRVLKSRLQTTLLVHEAIELYNNRRPHLALKMKTPNMVHQ